MVMQTLTVSTKELRQDFGKVVEAMRQGQSLLLLYRSRPLAELKPVLSEPVRLRAFSPQRIREWLADDRLSEKQRRRIDEIVKRLP